VTEALPDARFPSLKNVMGAKRKPMQTLTTAELGVDAAGNEAARSIVIAVAQRPARTAGTKLLDDGSAGRQLAEFLTERGLA
jgi:electron transfer flavoprotein beta subunit